MTRCRLHIFPPDDDPDENATERLADLRESFDEMFTEVDTAHVQGQSSEWVSAVFEDTDENMAQVDAFESACESRYPEGTVLRTTQQRDVMDGGGSEHDYERAIMLQITHALV